MLYVTRFSVYSLMFPVFSYSFLVLSLLNVACTDKSIGQEVIRINHSQINNSPNDQSLNERLEIAHNLAKKNNSKNGYWIGYCISRLMEKNSYVGAFDSRKRNTKSIFEMVYGVKNESEPTPEFDSDCGKMVYDLVEEGTIIIGDGKDAKIVKKIAVLILFEKEYVREVNISNMSLHADLDEKPLYWLEAAHDDESVELLKSMFQKTKTNEVKEDVIRAIGLHQPSDEIFLFLKNILLSKADDDVREESVFWIGQQEHEEVISLLTATAQKDNSEDVREKAVFSLSQVETETATDSLISLARKGKHAGTRSKALFWLAEKASKKALDAIKDVVFDDDEDAEVQRQALFALTQMDNHDGVNELIKIAQKHHNPKLRKEAIFWLGQSEDERAVEALVEIVKN